MEVVYPFPETLLRVSQGQMARHRLLGFNMIRSNPKFCGDAEFAVDVRELFDASADRPKRSR